MVFSLNLGSLGLETLLLTSILDQWLSKCVPWTSITKIIQKLHKNVNNQAPFQIYWIRNARGRLMQTMSISLSKNSSIWSSLRAIALQKHPYRILQCKMHMVSLRRLETRLLNNVRGCCEERVKKPYIVMLTKICKE